MIILQLGNFVHETGPAQQKGKFVGVSALIGMPTIAPQVSSRRSVTDSGNI